MNWTRNGREIWYLAAVFLASLGLSLLSVLMMLSPSLIPTQSDAILYPLLFILLPILPHLPAYVYGIYIQESRASGAVPHQKVNYLLPLVISSLVSVVVSVHMVMMVYGHPPIPPPWRGEVTLVFIILLVPTFHAYFEYYGDFREVVIFFMIYAPWVQFLRLFTGYTRFV